MKKLIATLLALILALTCTLSLAETTEVEAPAATPALPAMTITTEYTLDRDVLAADLTALGLHESVVGLIDTLASVINESSQRFIFADNGIEAALSLKGEDILTLVGEMNDDGIALATNLLPSYVLTVSGETIANLFQGFAAQVEDSGIESLDMDAIAQALTTHIQGFVNTCVGSISYGESEIGDYVLDGISYNVKTPVNVDIEAIINGLNKLQADLTADETIQAALQQLEQMGFSVTGGEPISTENLPTMTMDFYMAIDENGNMGDTTDMVFDVYPAGSEEAATWGDVLVQEGDVRVVVQIADQEEGASPATVMYEIKSGDTGVNHRLDLDIKDIYVGFACNLENLENGMTVDSDIFFLDREKPLVCERGTLVMDGQRTIALDDGSRTPLALEDLADEENSSEAISNLTGDLQNGFMSLVFGALQAMPEEIGSLLGSFATGETAEEPAEAPAEAPAA